jgi:hypothetical protein
MTLNFGNRQQILVSVLGAILAASLMVSFAVGPVAHLV